MASGGVGDEEKKEDIADALSRIEHDAPSESVPPAPSSPPPPPAPQPPPARAAEFRRPTRPTAPPGASPPRPAAPKPPAPPAAPRTAAPTPPSSPAPAKQPPRPPATKAKPARPQRPDRPDRPTGPPTTAWSEDEAAQVAAHYEPLSEVINDDDDAVIVPAPEPDIFIPHTPAASTPVPATSHAVGVAKSLAFRRTVIPILLTCGAILIGIGLLRWLGGPEAIFADMSIPLSTTLCGSGFFLLLVAVLNMLQVRAELTAAAKRAA